MAARVFMKLSKTVLTFAALVFLTVNPAAAADKAAVSAEPDPNANPMLAQYIKDGMKLYYLGNHSGLDGWFLVKDGQVQIVYTTTDKQSILIGSLYGTDGHAVTEDQLKVLANTHQEVASLLQEGVTQAGANGVAFAQSSSTDNTFKPLQSGERLMRDLQVAGGVDLGNAKAPLLYMIMAPDCPHCQATWRILHDPVFKGTLQVRLIPIGRSSDEERAAAQLLDGSDPLNAWDKYVGGEKAQLAGSASPLALAAVKTNHTLTDAWHIKETPYMAYRAKDGKVKIIAGEPEKMDALLNDIGP